MHRRRRRRPARPRTARLAAAQVRYQLRLLVRSPIASFATLVIPLMVLLAVNLLFNGTRLPTRGNVPYAQFFTPAMVAFAVVNACYMSVVSSTALAREQGILKRLRSTPLPPWIYMTGRIGAAGLVALVASAAVLAAGAGLYDFEFVGRAIPVLLVTLAVAVFCFCALGLAVTVIVPTADAALPMAWGTILPLCFISDVFQPIDSAPHWLRAVASFFPLRPFADALETALNPVAGSAHMPWGRLEVMLAWGAAAAVFALVFFRWQPEGERRSRADARPGDRVRARRIANVLSSRAPGSGPRT